MIAGKELWYNLDMQGKDDGLWLAIQAPHPSANACVSQLISPAARIHSLLLGSMCFWDANNERQLLQVEKPSKANCRDIILDVTDALRDKQQIVVSVIYNEAQETLQLTLSGAKGHLGSVNLSFKRVGLG